jgi:RNA polymerase subunit RPABC4/transcription elongation factor Spt4
MTEFMQVRHEPQTGLTAEVKIIPSWAWVLGGIAFVAAQVFFNVYLAHEPHPPSPWARPLLGLLAGLGGGCFLLLLGYINRDANRRGMSPTLWTLLALLIPNALGILLYFVLRQPRRSACPQCGHAVQMEFNFCPQCNCKLSPSCSQCQRVISANDVFCPYCGASQRTPATPTASATGLPG